MSNAAKALILTWVIIGLLIVGGVGFYLGRVTAQRFQIQTPAGIEPPGQPTGGLKPPSQQGGPAPKQGGQQNPPAGGGQPPQPNMR